MNYRVIMDENSKVSQCIAITRRGFVKAAVAVGAAAAIIPHLPVGETLFRHVSAEEAATLQQASTQITQCVYDGFGFCGTNMGAPSVVVDVQNGKILRVRPLHFDWKYTLSDFNYSDWAITAGNGVTFTPPTKTLPPPFIMAYKKRAYSPNRVAYCLQRVDWNPGGSSGKGYAPQNRGISGFVRITWDQAVSTITSELKRINSTYGAYAMYALNNTFHGETKNLHGRGGETNLLNMAFGGVTCEWRDPDSWEGWYWGAKHSWGMDSTEGNLPYTNSGTLTTNFLVDVLENTGLCIFVGCDPDSSPWGWGGQMADHYCYWLKQADKHVIYITPGLNWGAAVHADKWIPVIPNTDIAWQLAVAYTWITEGTYDTSYVATHTFGFNDADLLPLGVPAGTSWYSYVMGQGPDGIPKTPKWAEGICGIPARIIKALAREWAAKPTTTFQGNGGGYIRGPYASEPARGEVNLHAMQGIGAPGRLKVKMIEWNLMVQDPFPVGNYYPSANAASPFPMGFAVSGVTNAGIQKCKFKDAVLNPPVTWYGTTSLMAPVQDQFNKFTYPGNSFGAGLGAPRPTDSSSTAAAATYPEIHMIWETTANLTGDWVGGFRTVEAFRSPKIEFFLSQVPWLENDALYADMVLPVTTLLEDDVDLNAEVMGGTFFNLVLQNQAIEPIGDSLSDYQIVQKLASALGVASQIPTAGLTDLQVVENAFKVSGCQNDISWADFQANQYYVVPVNPKWASLPRGFSEYYNAATGSGLNTKSGMIEFYCQWLAAFNQSINSGKDDPERPAVAHYIPYGPSHQESLVCARAQTYPLLAVTPHPHWRVHTEHEDISWLREIPTMKVRGPDGYQYECVWINPVDAASRGINNGDVVSIFNERGTILGGAYVTERTMPGAIWMDHASRMDPIVDNIPVSGVELDGIPITNVGIDRGGSNNLLAPYTGQSQNASGNAANSYLVQVAKADLASLQAQYPAAFARAFDPAVGPIPVQTMVTSSTTTT